MTTEPIAPDPQDVAELERRVALKAVLVQNLLGNRIATEVPGGAEIQAQVQVAPGATTVDYQLTLSCSLKSAQDASASVAELAVTVVAHYSLQEGRELAEPVFSAFGDQAIQVLWPYASQHIHDIASRLGYPGVIVGPLRRADNLEGLAGLAPLGVTMRA